MILERVCRGERLETYETERIRADGVRISVSLTVSPIRRPAGDLIGASVIARDITAEKRSRDAEAFLVAASRKLDASLDPIETARTIVSTAVPELAEVCVIDFLRADGWLGDSVVAGVDPEVAATLEEIRRKAPLNPNGEHPVAQVLRSGMPTNWRDLRAPGVIDSVAQSEEHRRLIDVRAIARRRPCRSSPAGGRSASSPSFTRAATSATTRRILPFSASWAIGLRWRSTTPSSSRKGAASLRTCSVGCGRRRRRPCRACRSLSSSSPRVRAPEIGGDFYDVIPTEDGCWLLIGDVAGKGSAAAGVSVAIRHAVRGLCREIADPGEVLARVNELLIEGDSLNDFATAELVRMQRDGSGWTLKLAVAGHPPAVHVSARGPRNSGAGRCLAPGIRR